jgi:hypothetical protein
MPKDLIVRVLGDTTHFEKNLAASTATATKFEKTIKRVGVTSEESARAQIAASQRKDARLREEIALYRDIARAATKGSQEQRVAAGLAERSERQLARSLGVTAAEARKLSTSSVRFDKDLSRATRGALAGSGIFSKFGRSLAFASGGFLAFSGVSSFLRSSIDAAKEEAVAEKQLQTQFKANRETLAPYRREIEKFTDALSAKSGFENDQLVAGLTTILRTQPNVTKALRDEATAADLARAKHLSLSAASTILAKVEGGNTTLLRRQGIQVAKNATAEQALAVLRQRVAGQAAAGATQQEKFGAVLHRTEEIVGAGLLPTLNRYLASGSRWLEQMNQSGQLQKKVAGAADDVTGALRAGGKVIHDVDRVTGGFKNTLELLLALKVASWAGGIAGSLARLGGRFSAARGGVSALKGDLAVGNASLAAEAGVAAFALTTLGLHATGMDKRLKSAGGEVEKLADQFHFFGRSDPLAKFTKLQGTDKPGQIAGVDVGKVIRFAKTLQSEGKSNDAVLSALESRFATLSEADLKILLRIAGQTGAAFAAVGDSAEAAGIRAAHGINLAVAAAADAAKAPAVIDTSHPVRLTRSQQNQFFDAKTQRAIDAASRLAIDEQISALDRIESRLKARLAKTKDVTRQQNLEDQILSVEDQKKQVRGDIRQKFLDSLSNATGRAEYQVQVAQATVTVDDDIAALKKLEASIEAEIKAQGRTNDLVQQLFQTRQDLAAARATKIAQRQFVALGLTPGGDKKTPGVRALRRELGTVESAISGTFLDTSKTQSLLARVRKVLSGGMGKVGEDVRQKIQQILGGLNSQLDQSTKKNETKWQHLSTSAFLAGIPNLTAAQRRALESKFATLGPGGTTPGGSTAAFALAGGRGNDRTQGDVYLDGQKVGTITKKHQNARGKKRTVPRNA